MIIDDGKAGFNRAAGLPGLSGRDMIAPQQLICVTAAHNTMKSPWTPERDKRLIAMQAQGVTASQIAEELGTTRSAVIGRSVRLRGIVYQSNIESWKRANEKRRKGPRKPEALRRRTIAQLARDIGTGVPRGEAIVRASKGAIWRDIGDYFGITSQAAQQAARAWRERMAIPAHLRRGPGRPRKNP
jgi:GcrA cell cycle regulator